MTSEPIRIGTRSSALALWQAEFVQNQLNDLGYATEIVPISHELFLESTDCDKLGVQFIYTHVIVFDYTS